MYLGGHQSLWRKRVSHPEPDTLSSFWAELFSPQKTFACSSPGVWTGTFPLLNMIVAYGKQRGENPASNQNTSVFKYSELHQADIKVKMGKLEVSACRTFLHRGLATLRERDSVGCFQCQSATEACCYAILRVTEVSIIRRSENTTRIAVLQIQRQISCLKATLSSPTCVVHLAWPMQAPSSCAKAYFYCWILPSSQWSKPWGITTASALMAEAWRAKAGRCADRNGAEETG